MPGAEKKVPIILRSIFASIIYFVLEKIDRKVYDNVVTAEINGKSICVSLLEVTEV